MTRVLTSSPPPSNQFSELSSKRRELCGQIERRESIRASDRETETPRNKTTPANFPLAKAIEFPIARNKGRNTAQSRPIPIREREPRVISPTVLPASSLAVFPKREAAFLISSHPRP
ncbi:hypothetical protein Ddc_15381 [Ditylenchus destructor]|nr:hypothetical protein Ddc_15381 [Ditylenchus destructor]